MIHSHHRVGLWHPREKPMYGMLLNPYHPLARGLVGCWLFNEGGGNTVFDLSGNSNHGSLGGGTASYCPVWTTETFGPALSFDNDYVDCGDDFTVLSTEFTIEFWMKSSDTVHSGTPISYATTHSDNEILLHDYNAFLLFIGNVQTFSGVSATDGNLHHIVWTWKSSGGETKLYKDAEVVYSGVLQSGYTINHGTDRRMIIGQEQDSIGGGFDSSQAFYGTLSILRIYKRFLNPMEIWLLYTDPFCMFYHPLEKELLKITGIAPLNIEIPLNCKSSSKLISKNSISNDCKLKDTYQKEYYSKNLFNLISDSKFNNEFQLSLFQSLLVPLCIYPYYYHPIQKGIINVLKPSIYADNYYYAYPTWLPSEGLEIQLALSCIDSFRLVHDSLILKIYGLEDTYFKNFISNIPFHLLFDDRFVHESQLLDFQSLLCSSWLSAVIPLDVKLSVDTHKNFTFSYENSLIDTLLFSTSKYYVVGSVVIPLALGSQYISLCSILSANSSLSLKSNYKNFISSRLDIPLIISPLITEILEQQDILSFSIDNAFVPVIKTTFDSYIIQSLDSQIFSSSVRDLNVPINLFFNYMSSMLSIINFSNTLSTSSKMALENMIESIVPAILKDTYSSEYVGKATLDVSTDAEFVPLIQMIYEYSLTAPLLFSPILTTVKKVEALIKYLTIDIKKFNISIDIETIEQDG